MTLRLFGVWLVAASLVGQFIYRLPSSYTTQCGSTITCRYLRASASGSGSGQDWTNAYATVSAAVSGMTRGWTLYVADGDYGEATWSKANSGTTAITVKKAIASDHGTNTDWQAGFGDGRARFTRWIFTTDYWVMDGQVGAGADTLYGAPAVPGYVTHGFEVVRNTVSDGAGSVMSMGGVVPRTDITIRHTEGWYSNTPRSGPAWANQGDASSIIGSSVVNLTLQYVWFHDAGTVVIFQRYPGTLAEYSVFERNGHSQVAGGYSPAQHSELLDFTEEEGGVDVTLRYNWMRDWRSTGGVIILDHDIAENVKIYGNILQDTGYWNTSTEAEGGNGAISANDAAVVISAFVYHNTFINLRYDKKIFLASDEVATAKNNLFYNTGTMAFGLGVTHNFNAFIDAGSHSEPNGISGSGDPFTNLASLDLTLSDDIGNGEALTAEYQTDPNGVTRTNWTPGAFEFVDASPISLMVQRSVR